MACMLINIFLECFTNVLQCLQEIFVNSYYSLLFKQQVMMYSALVGFLQIKLLNSYFM